MTKTAALSPPLLQSWDAYGRSRTLLPYVNSCVTRRFWLRYYALTEKPLGVTGEVAELEAAEALNLALAPARQPDYDAFQNNNGKVERYQIKGRAIAPNDRYRGRVP